MIETTRAGRQPLLSEEVNNVPKVTVPWPQLARECHHLWETSHNFMVEFPRTKSRDLQSIEWERLEFKKLPSLPSTFPFWMTNFRTEVSSGSCHPFGAMQWIRDIEKAHSHDDF